MKTIWILFCLLITWLSSTSVQASVTFGSVDVLYGASGQSDPTMEFYFSIISPRNGAYTAKYYDPHAVPRNNDYLVTDQWSGPGAAPIIQIVGFGNAGASQCPGLPSGRNCQYLTFSITIDAADDFGCPWLASVYSVVTDYGASYRAPTANSTVCPTVPVDTFDVSWSENRVNHNLGISLHSTGGFIEKTVSTYLMESNKLCDSSVMDRRGDYCRFVSGLITFSSYGCDNAKVTVTPIEQAVTDKKLHDIVVRVDTSSMQPIDSSCRFQYILNEL